MFLMNNFTGRNVAPSPNNLRRLWNNCDDLVTAFAAGLEISKNVEVDSVEHILYRMRFHTLHYRVNLDRENCLLVIGRIADKLDSKTKNKYDVSNRYKSLVDLLDKCIVRLREYCEHGLAVRNASDKAEVKSAIGFILSKSGLAKRLWTKFNARTVTFDDYQYLAIQIVEVAQEWIYTFSPEDLTDVDRATLEMLSLKPGDLNNCKFEHLFMDNPVWAKPIVLRADGSFFTGQLYAAFTFPFRVLDALAQNDHNRLKLLPDCRSEVLEDLVFETISDALPSAKVYRNVKWTDPKSRVSYENDVVAILGNQIFVIEVKSGKIQESAKRGAEKSFRSSIREVFVEPALQSERLKHYLSENSLDVKLFERKTNTPVIVDLSKPKEVYRFSVSMESFASITSSRRIFEKFGLIDTRTPWAPILSFGELRMIWKFLDSEVSFGHYLSRRYSIDKLIDFEGDEQHLLSMYLANGFCISGSDTTKHRVILNSDNQIRVHKTPRTNRSNADVLGIKLTTFWKRIVESIYLGDPGIDEHKFDILFTILNQPPKLLRDLQRRVSKLRSGGGGISRSGEHSKLSIGNRQYIVMINLIDIRKISSPESLTDTCLHMATVASYEFQGNTDCVVLTFMKHKRNSVFDGVAFFRLIKSNGQDVRLVI